MLFTLRKREMHTIKKRFIFVGIITLLAALLLFKIYYLDNNKDDKQNKSAIEHVSDNEKNTSRNSNTTHAKNGEKSNIQKVNWKKFSQATKAVLEIPDVLEYPVVQAKDNSYYLHRGLDKTYKYSGTLFIDCNNNSDFTDDNTIIYGHNMTSGSMFGSLKKYKSESYLAKHKYFYVYTRNTKEDSNKPFRLDHANWSDEVLKYEIKNVCVVNLGSKIYTLQFGDDFTQQDYINRYHGLFGNKLDTDKKICTLSTCTNFGRQRLCIQGSLISRKTLKN